jgi:hypothetical protein
MQTCFRLFCLLAVFLCAAVPAAAQEIDVRLSVKFILDSNGNPPSGPNSSPAAVQNVIDQANGVLRRWGRGYRYVITESNNVVGAGGFYNVVLDSKDNPQVGGYYGLEEAARADPVKFYWRDNATNVFIVNTLFGGNAGAAAIPSAPQDQRGTGQPPFYKLVVLSVNLPDVNWLHELGHHNDLIHTFDNDLVADTRPDPNPFQCTVRGGNVLGGTMECGCATKLQLLNNAAQAGGWSQQELDDIRFNSMSYHCGIDFNNVRRTEGQLDRWADATRRYHRGEVSGATFFVDRNRPPGGPAPDGLSTNPYPTVAQGFSAAVAEFSLPESSAPGSGNVVLVRAGNYNERITLSAPAGTIISLRAPRGSVVTIGRP